MGPRRNREELGERGGVGCRHWKAATPQRIGEQGRRRRGEANVLAPINSRAARGDQGLEEGDVDLVGLRAIDRDYAWSRKASRMTLRTASDRDVVRLPSRISM
jgi:hypothetical protein